ncbi:MAG: DUF1501 domain-containing protein [Myxococcota bacterium]
MNRRSFLRNGLCLGGAALGLSPSRWAQALEPGDPDLYYVFAYFSGGWDILLSLDPKDPTRFGPENIANTLVQPAYELLESSDGQLIDVGGRIFGPHIGGLALHADKLAVLNGMSMETLTHEAGRRRFLTGKAPAGLQARGSSASTWLAAHYGNRTPIPNLSVRVESYNVDNPAYATALRANEVPDLMEALQPNEPLLPESHRVQLDALMRQTAACPGPMASPTWQRAEEGRLKAREMAFSGLDELFNFRANTPQMQAVRDHYGIPNNNAGLRSSQAQAAMAAAAIKGGVSRCVTFQATSGLDTHFQEWASDQGPRQEAGFEVVARLVEDLAASPYGSGGESWLDHTVIVGFSEFSRTPLLNGNGGRDHSLTNSCFLIGAGIKAGTYGASSDLGMSPMTVDLATGRPSAGGEVISPEHVIRSLMEQAGVRNDVADLRVEPYRAILKS